jgi:hypothetical protein
MTSQDGPVRPPIEPLSDVAWARIERGVWGELDAAPAPDVTRDRRWAVRPVWLAVGGALVAAAAIAAVVVMRHPVDRVASDGPSRVTTGDGPSDLTFGDARVSVAPRSAVLLTGSAEAGAVILIERGAASFEVAPRADRPPFVVHAGAVTVRVIGTRFSVARDGDNARVAVDEGVVMVVAPGVHVMLRAGEHWPSALASAPVIHVPSALASAPPSTAPPSTPPPIPAPIPPPLAPTVPSRRPVAPTALDPARAFAAAAALEAADPRAALAGYRALARGTGPWAANALYAAGRLAVDRGDATAARADLTAYLRRFPTGPNAADARGLLAHLPGANP